MVRLTTQVLLTLTIAINIHATAQLTPAPQSETARGLVAISGVITHADGTPVVAVDVGVIKAMDTDDLTEGGLTLRDLTALPRLLVEQLTAIDRTNGAGIYRLENLPPGRYFVVIGPVNSPISGGVWFKPYIAGPYFPQLPAGVVVVRVGATMPEYRLPGDPPASNVFRVTGHVSGIDLGLFIPPPKKAYAQAAKEVFLYPGPACGITLRAASRPALTGRVAPDGSYAVRNVSPGTYAACVPVRSDVDAGSARRSATVFTVTNKDVVVDIVAGFPKGGSNQR